MILSGINLGERHRDLNSKVAEAVANKTNFTELTTQQEQSDVDKLFKINLASKYKDVDYILDVLKCGDVFHITQALKCLWLYGDEYSQYINRDYLENIIFPKMSAKMKRKMITSISTHVTNANRCVDFYKYCKEAKLNNYAVKFLVNTPESFKLNSLQDQDNLKDIQCSKCLEHFVGNSFTLALAYLRLYNYTNATIYELRFLYSVSDEQYLEISEKYFDVSARYPNVSNRLGIRISRNILKRHIKKIIDRPLLYVNILNKSMLVKYLTLETVKSLTCHLLPSCLSDFWSLDFYKNYKFILEKIPRNEIFHHLKEIYISKYKDETFEMRIEFYKLQYYEMFNIDEREAWALRHIELDKELPGIQNYIWYKFVSLQKAFSGIKRYIFLTPDEDKRSIIINILPETARNMDDVNKILVYYYERHINESEDHKESFINKVIECHDIYEFSDGCWTSFDALLCSLDLYTTGCGTRQELKFRSLLYHIIHSKELPEVLKEYIDCVTHFYDTKSLVDELLEERKEVVAKYLLNCYVDKIQSLMDDPKYGIAKDDADEWLYDSIPNQIQDFICRVWHVIDIFNRNKEDCPKLVLDYMEANKSDFEHHEIYKPKFERKSEEDFVRWLKQDIDTAVDGIYDIRFNTYRWNFRLCRLFRKLKVYFKDDVGKEYLDYFEEYLSDIPKGYREYRNIKMAVVGVFYLAEPNAIITFLEKNAPATPKIQHHVNRNNALLQVQKAISRLAYHARPPIPFSIFKKYIVGDYVHFSLPVIYNNFANLASNVDFIETLLDAPLSIQKHGLRLAFKSYNTDRLKTVIVNAWKRTKNVSLRLLLYETLFYKFLEESEKVQRELYEVLKYYTTELNHDDDERIYALLVSDDLPDVFKDDFIKTAWITVDKLPHKSVDIKRRISVIHHMEKYLHLIERDFPRHQIIDEHVNDMLFEQNIRRDYDEYEYNYELLNAKWNLTEKYIISFTTKVEKRKSIDLLRTILSCFINSWDLIRQNTYIIRKCMQKFINALMDKDPKSICSCKETVAVYQCILRYLQKRLKKEEIYLINWKLQLSISCRNIINNGRGKADSENWSSKEIAYAFGKEITKMLINFIEKKDFYFSFYESIANVIKIVSDTICTILGINTCGFLYNLSDSLTDTKMTETHVLALVMLPRDPSYNYREEHVQSITKIRQFDSEEIRAYLYKEYMWSDCRVRNYV